MPFDKDRYPPNWREISARIMRRDDYTCQHCGAHQGEVGVHLESGEWVLTEDLLARVEDGHAVPAQGSLFGASVQPNFGKEKKCVLTVAHLDRNPRNNSFFNLAALCNYCHLNYDRSQHIRNRRYGRYHKRRQLNVPFPPGRSLYKGKPVGQGWEGADKGKQL